MSNGSTHWVSNGWPYEGPYQRADDRSHWRAIDWANIRAYAEPVGWPNARPHGWAYWRPHKGSVGRANAGSDTKPNDWAYEGADEQSICRANA